MAYECLLYEVKDRIATMTLNRPERLNALGGTLREDMYDALLKAGADPNVGAIVITGAGRGFCSGGDVKSMSERDKAAASAPITDKFAPIRDRIILAMRDCPKPIIAAINGPVVAGGAGLLLASDIVVAAPEAKFGLPEPRRGIVAGMVAPLLGFRVGATHAANLLLTARMIEAAEAHRIGLYHEIVSADLVWARGQEIAGEIAHSAPESIQLTKRLLNETIGEHLETLLTAGAADSATARTTEAAREGLAAFLEKREPRWL